MKRVVRNRVFLIIILIFSILFLSNVPVQAISFTEIIESADDFLGIGEGQEQISESDLQTISDTIYSILLLIAIGATVIVGLIMGIKFITGSIEEQAKIKESIIPYIIGCVVVFAGFTIWKVLVNILQDVT